MPAARNCLFLFRCKWATFILRKPEGFSSLFSTSACSQCVCVCVWSEIQTEACGWYHTFVSFGQLVCAWLQMRVVMTSKALQINQISMTEIILENCTFQRTCCGHFKASVLMHFVVQRNALIYCFIKVKRVICCHLPCVETLRVLSHWQLSSKQGMFSWKIGNVKAFKQSFECTGVPKPLSCWRRSEFGGTGTMARFAWMWKEKISFLVCTKRI